MAKKNSRPMFRSATPQVGVIGMIAKAISKALMATTGARVKITLSTKGGFQSSLKNIFSMSAAIWNMPNGPTRFGP
ncbi:hypothetical protein D3C85_1763510 [compost metagenome]